MRLLNYVLKRLLYSIPVLIGVTLLVFIISHAIPGDPARMMAGQKASREAVQNLRHSMGLDRPLPEQYLRYLAGLAQGDLGKSIRNQRPVLDDLKDFFPATLELTMTSMVFCIAVGLPLGSSRRCAGTGPSTTPRGSSRSWASPCRSSGSG
jgi:peptide/nickel transport system permease protein